MQTEEFRAVALNNSLLVASTVLWINLLRVGLRDRWTWPIEPRRPVPWRLFEAVGFIVIVLFSVTALLQQAFALAPTPPYTVQHVQVTCLSVLVQLGLVPLILSIFCPCQWADFGIRRQGILHDLQFAIWGVLLAQLPVHLISYPLQSIRSAKPHALFELLQSSEGSLAAIIWIGVAVVVMAPLLEELLFRVLLQGALERETSPAWAILLTAAAFVSTHSIVDWAPLLPLALILGYVYYRRRSYLSVVVLHGLFNAVNLLSAVWTLKATE